ncbi:uncharacterized protein LOC114877482 isoform X2 [Osmia bicornis bicornis]|uniref:uncharacterized protein LOC114877482 isoform X2 n=1 Tax=Osmia bicornis bicornis TaxID=1437191 RepID=UPI001EAF2087|nr:uncharacterized protein LOC114877482 isoform X2 [Osmia bicornis bicornis]
MSSVLEGGYHYIYKYVHTFCLPKITLTNPAKYTRCGIDLMNFLNMTNNDDADINQKNIKIFVRVFPFEKLCESCAKIDTERKKIYIRCLQEMQSNRIATSKEPSYWCFQVDDIFHDSSQEEVYRVSTEDLVPKGLIARLISQMFAEKRRKKKSNKIQYCVSYVELHGREAKDLLTYEENRVRINDRDPFKDISVVMVENAEEALRKVFEGEVRRSSVKGSTYPVSHLATALITFHVSNISLITSWGTVTTAKMHIVEMAGTGTVGKSSNCWKAATDVGIANLTKTQLEQFFSYLSAGRISASTLIRSSNLLKILGNAFSVSSIIRFISHVRIKEEDLNITLSTLKLTAKIAKFKSVRVRENVKHQPDLLLHRLQDQVNALKKELMINDLFLQQEHLMNISESRMEQINRSVVNFLNGNISDFTLFSVSQAEILLKSIKDLYNRCSYSSLYVV